MRFNIARKTKTALIALVAVSACAVGNQAWAIYGVRVSDLTKITNMSATPALKNPVKVWGKVTSASPLKISDGRAEVTVIGVTAKQGDYLVVVGNWNGSYLTVSGPVEAITGTSKISLAYIPAGTFLMGNSGVGDDASYGLPNEFPQRSVSVPGYYISKTEVTRGQYKLFIDAGGYSTQSYWSAAGWTWKVSKARTQPANWDAAQTWIGSSFMQTDDSPVVGVTYYEAEAFCNWAGGHLPTEAQWEKAARWDASTWHARIYPWGDTYDNSMSNNWWDTAFPRMQTSPVGSYPAGSSLSGCLDMAGNVWEWCQDWYKSYQGNNTYFDFTNTYRVLRGGAWSSDLDHIDSRCAFRYRDYPIFSNINVGFRMAR